MDYLVSPNECLACFAGYHLQDCAVVNQRLISLVLRNFADCEKADSLQDQKIRKKLVWLDISPAPDPAPPDKVEEEPFRYGGCVLQGADVMFTAAVHRPDTQFLYAAANGFMYRYDSDGFADEADYIAALGLPESSYAFGARTVCGDLYVFGAEGLLIRRTDRDVWQNLSIPRDQFPGATLTLLSVDAFAPDDLYALSWKDGMFHYNGKAWRRVHFPSNIALETLCCAPDGQVYVSGQRGTLFAGRGSRWDRVHEGTLTLPFRDTVWYADALWCTNDYGVWTLRDTAKGPVFARAPVADDVYFCSGHLSAGDDRLLLGGMNGAAIFDGKDWQTLYYQPEILLGMMENEA